MPLVKLENGHYAIVCTRGHRQKSDCQFCGKQSHFLCDYEIVPGKTCDKRMCLKCATRVRVGIDYCPEHKNCEVK